MGIKEKLLSVAAHHKAIAKHLHEQFGEPASVANYRDDYRQRPIAIGAFGPAKSRFFSTIGICDRSFKIPTGRFEFAAAGALDWLPNALASSVYWLDDRHIEEWPLVCEDVVKANVKSTYRHMGYFPSIYQFAVKEGAPVQWLLGVPLKDSEVGLNAAEIKKKVVDVYPGWLWGAQQELRGGREKASRRSS